MLLRPVRQSHRGQRALGLARHIAISRAGRTKRIELGRRDCAAMRQFSNTVNGRKILVFW